MRNKLIELLLASDIKDKHDAEDKVDEILDLFNVSQQRELLEAFVKQIKEDNELVDDITFQDINKCLASNCG